VEGTYPHCFSALQRRELMHPPLLLGMS
jgi:hypothetical protein